MPLKKRGCNRETNIRIGGVDLRGHFFKNAPQFYEPANRI